MKQLLQSFLWLLPVSFCCTSCGDWLSIVPQNKQVSDDYWESQSAVEDVIASGYYYLRSTVEGQLIPYGELRAGLIYSRGGSKLQSFEVTPAQTSLCDWSMFYKIINIANTVLLRAPEALAVDDTYTEVEYEAHRTEALFLRAICYFYLVRNWRDVPLVTVAYTDDGQNFNNAKSDEATVMAQVLRDVSEALATGAAPEGYATTAETKGRATRWALLALGADAALWNEDYDLCISYCEQLLSANSLSAPVFLTEATQSGYFSMFNPGNSCESIFELQWNREEEQTNNLTTLFYPDATGIYRVGYPMCSQVEEEFDAAHASEEIANKSPRTLCSAFYAGSTDAILSSDRWGYCWKYVGSTMRGRLRTIDYYDAHFIIYRVTDVMLMMAEALIRRHGIEMDNADAVRALSLIDRVRARAGLDPLLVTTADGSESEVLHSQLDLLEALLKERRMEFLGEGKIWYDVLRMGRADGGRYRDDLLVNQVIAYNTQASTSWLRQVLRSEGALFLPVSATEIRRNPNIDQNIYYK